MAMYGYRIQSTVSTFTYTNHSLGIYALTPLSIAAHVHRNLVIMRLCPLHTFTTLLLSLSLTPPAAGSDHLPPADLLSQSGRGRSFSVSGPTVWNSLPSELRLIDCRRQLKSHLFQLAFKLTNSFINCYNARYYAPLFLSLVFCKWRNTYLHHHHHHQNESARSQFYLTL